MSTLNEQPKMPLTNNTDKSNEEHNQKQETLHLQLEKVRKDINELKEGIQKAREEQQPKLDLSSNKLPFHINNNEGCWTRISSIPSYPDNNKTTGNIQSIEFKNREFKLHEYSKGLNKEKRNLHRVMFS
jgi:TolA-binding protein